MKRWKCLILAALLATSAKAAEIDFNRDIRPIISENCVHCHGPDQEARKADLRLDIAEGVSKDLGGYQVVAPGHPEKSELWLRVNLDDKDDDLMPPRKSKRQLSIKDKALIKEWIESGGKYDQHWAFVKPKQRDIPRDKKDGAIDYFAEKILREKGLRFSEKAAPHTLIRRASLDLIGLPPGPEEVAAFEKSYQADSKTAYEKLIDQLLASPRFGERWARPWLDLARYADSNGFQADQLRDSWAYRDWVIDALNANMPFDQFTIEQLAGDLLPNSTIRQKIATGFHRTVTCNVEAGVHPEENRTNQVVDRVNTTGTVWLGVTMECAQCHDHKYDPFTMKEYYQLFAYFNNTPFEVSKPTSPKDVSHDFVGPFMDLPQSKKKADKRKELESQVAIIAKQKKELNDADKFAGWQKDLLNQAGVVPKWENLTPRTIVTTGGETSEILEDDSILVTDKFSPTTRYTVEVGCNLETLNGIRLEALTHDRLPGKGPGRGDPVRTNFVLTEFQLLADDKPVSLINARADFSQTKWEVGSVLDGNNKTGWGIAPEFSKDHWATFQTAQPVSVKAGTKLTFILDHQYRGGRTLGCFRISGSSSIPQSKDLDPSILTILEKKKQSGADKKKLQALFEKSDPDWVALNKKEKGINAALSKLKPDQTLVMEELEENRMTHVMNRGNYLDKGIQVSAGTPAVLPPIAKDLPPNRLGLAKWLVSRDNPLVARVVVNRWWAEIFGRGIVATVEDFGTQSEPPTHPDLLDWLAVEFMNSGWNQKHVLKEILLSDLYQQSSRIDSSNPEIDPANHYLARAPRFRLEAERVRDNALTVSGLLSTKMYGRPVMPFQPDNIWRQVGRNEPKWVEASDENRWRRGIYIVYRRAAPYPSMVNFDAPDRAACTVQRPRTNTPLQALTLLNDPAYVEMALAFADRILSESKSENVEERIDYAYQIALARDAKPQEIGFIREIVAERVKYFESNADVAEEIIKNASKVYSSKYKKNGELAAWFYVANILLNLDEVITKS